MNHEPQTSTEKQSYEQPTLEVREKLIEITEAAPATSPASGGGAD